MHHRQDRRCRSPSPTAPTRTSGATVSRTTSPTRGPSAQVVWSRRFVLCGRVHVRDGAVDATRRMDGRCGRDPQPDRAFSCEPCRARMVEAVRRRRRPARTARSATVPHQVCSPATSPMPPARCRSSSATAPGATSGASDWLPGSIPIWVAPSVAAIARVDVGRPPCVRRSQLASGSRRWPLWEPAWVGTFQTVT